MQARCASPLTRLYCLTSPADRCTVGFQNYFLERIMETISLLNPLLFEFLEGKFSVLTCCQRVSGYIRIRNCPSGRIVSKMLVPIVFQEIDYYSNVRLIPLYAGLFKISVLRDPTTLNRDLLP